MKGFVLPSDAHQSARSIAKSLGRSPSTVSREMSCHGGYDHYRATLRTRMPGRYLVVQNVVSWRPIRGFGRQVARKLRLDWSSDLSHLRSRRSMRRSRPVDPNGDRRGHMKDIVSIRQRPAAVKIGRSLAIGRAICCPGRTTAISRPWSSVSHVT